MGNLNMRELCFLMIICALTACTAAGCKKGLKQNPPSPAVQEQTVSAKVSVDTGDVQDAVAEQYDEAVISINGDFMDKAISTSTLMDAAGYDEYKIASFSQLDNSAFKFYKVSELEIYDDILSVLILASSENKNVCWLVNYDKDKNYISSLIVGYDEMTGNSAGVSSVINPYKKPCIIKQESYTSDSKELVKTELLSSGHFNEISRVDVGK